MNLTRLPDGHVGAVVTWLEMHARPEFEALTSPFVLEPWADPDPFAYRALFSAVGGRWLWYSRLAMDDAELRGRLGELHRVIGADGEPAGFIELDFTEPETAYIRFLGLVPELAGRGHGRWLFAEVLRLAWREGVATVKVHTCTLDHSAALPAYLRAGFVATARAFESFPDPRLAGLLPRDAAPQVPMLASEKS